VAIAPVLVWLIATGFTGNAAAFELATLMTRIMFPYILFMSLVSLAAGVLNVYGKFSIPAFTPVLLNLSFIGCALWLAPRLREPILALAVAVVIGGVLQLGTQALALRKLGLLPRIGGLRAAFADPAVRRILTLMLPAVFAVSVAQLSIIINTNIASHLRTGSVTWLTFADRLMEFPTALLGVALGTVLLPTLSKAGAEGRADDYSRLLDWGLRLTCLLALPAALGLWLLGDGMTMVLFQGGKFTVADARQTALALSGYAVGLLGLIAVKILAPGFYAKQDVKTPVKIALIALACVQLSNVALVPLYAHAALALSVSIGALVNAGLLLAGLMRRGDYRPQPGWAAFAAKLAVALGALAGLLWALRLRIDGLGPSAADWTLRATWLAAAIGAAVILYFGLLWLLGFRLRDFSPRAR
jgi:putative peptidoglycan lipid II flippase